MLPVVGSCCAKFETAQTFRRPFAQSLKENLELMLVVTSSVILFDPLRGGHFLRQTLGTALSSVHLEERLQQ